MLMMILGAGASYDAVPTHPPTQLTRSMEERLPLADELFDNRGTFAHFMRVFDKCLDIVRRLHRLHPPQTVEGALELLQSEAAQDPERIRQLTAVRFYIQNVIWSTEDRWQGIAQGMTNHRTLIDQIRDSRLAWG